jgi:hypothetical protein
MEYDDDDDDDDDTSDTNSLQKLRGFMIIFKIKSIYLLCIYITACFVASFKKPLWSN